MSLGTCNHCGASLPKDITKIYCDYCQSVIEERVTALTSFPTTKPNFQIDTTGQTVQEEQEDDGATSGNLIEKIIMMMIALFVLAFVLPPALNSITTSVLTSVNPQVISLFSWLVPIIVIIIVMLVIWKVEYDSQTVFEIQNDQVTGKIELTEQEANKKYGFSV